MSELARVAGPLAALGLALLLVAPRRTFRLGGSSSGRQGCSGLVAYLAPSTSTAQARSGRRRRPRRRGRRRLGARPLSLAARVRDARLRTRSGSRWSSGRRRRTCSSRSTPSSRSLALALAWKLVLARRARARAGPDRVAARRVRALDRPDAGLDDRPAQGRDLPRRVHPSVLPAQHRLRAAAVARTLADLALGAARGHGARIRASSVATSGYDATSSGTPE